MTEDQLKPARKWITLTAWPKLKEILASSSFWTAAATVAIAVSTIVYTNYAKKQWIEMRGQLDEMRKGSADTHNLAVAAKEEATNTQTIADSANDEITQLERLTESSGKNTVTAENALDLSRKQFRTENRPYVWAAPRGAYVLPNGGLGVFAPNGADTEIEIAVDLTNSGRSPAVDLANTPSQLKVGPALNAITEARNYLPIYPKRGGILTINTSITVKTETFILTPEQYSHIIDGSWTIYIVGAVKYADMFSPRIRPYETRYCFTFNPHGLPFGDCDFGDTIR